MSDTHGTHAGRRPLTNIERLFTRSPFSVVTMVARIRGDVTEGMVRDAVAAVQGRHLNLRACIIEDARGVPCLTPRDAELAVTSVPRQSDDHWIGVVQDACQAPFTFATQPAIRFVLVRSARVSELVIVCHHILCDGLSLAYLVRDLMRHLGDPQRPVEPLPDPVPMGGDNVPEGVSTNALVRFVINRMNRRWADERVVFDQQDYLALNRAYWKACRHQVLPVELTEAQTTALVQRCRAHGVTVNSALTAAYVRAQVVVQGEEPFHASIGVAASLRERLPRRPGEAMGFYAGLVRPRFHHDASRGFWENAAQLQGRVRPLLTDKHLFGELLMWCELDATILEAVNFKKLGRLVSEDCSSHEKLVSFSQRDDTVLAILKRDKMESLDRITMGTAVTNLTRMGFPRKYGALELDRLLIKPGGAFPLAQVNLVLGAVTCADKLSLVLEYVEDNIDAETMAAINERALGFLLEA